MAGRRLSPYRSRASPGLQLPAFTKFARSFGCRARAGGMKKVRKQVDQKTFNLLKKAGMRQLNSIQLDKINQIFGT
jgi:hypothetical protein